MLFEIPCEIKKKGEKIVLNTRVVKYSILIADLARNYNLGQSYTGGTDDL